MSEKQIHCPECGHRVNVHIYDEIPGEHLPICDIGACDCTLTPEGIIVMLGLDLTPLLETLFKLRRLTQNWRLDAELDNIGNKQIDCANDVDSILGDFWK